MNHDGYVEAVLRKADTLQKVNFWPSDSVRARAWLENFDRDERLPAAVILDNLVFYSNRNTNALLRATYQNLRDELALGAIGSDPLADTIYAPLEDERPNPSDSGWTFCRKARQVLDVPEERLLRPVDALQHAIAGRPVIFLDDFLGSGEQLYRTWIRNYRNSTPRSFAEAHAAKPFRAIYLVLVATQYGVDRARYLCPSVRTAPAHVLGDTYSIRNVTQLPHVPQVAGLNNQIYELLAKYSPRLKLKKYMRDSDFALFGFHSRGLLVAFQHGCPDASVPIIFAGADGTPSWTRLVTPA